MNEITMNKLFGRCNTFHELSMHKMVFNPSICNALCTGDLTFVYTLQMDTKHQKVSSLIDNDCFIQALNNVGITVHFVQ